MFKSAEEAREMALMYKKENDIEIKKYLIEKIDREIDMSVKNGLTYSLIEHDDYGNRVCDEVCKELKEYFNELGFQLAYKVDSRDNKVSFQVTF